MTRYRGTLLDIASWAIENGIEEFEVEERNGVRHTIRLGERVDVEDPQPFTILTAIPGIKPPEVVS